MAKISEKFDLNVLWKDILSKVEIEEEESKELFKQATKGTKLVKIDNSTSTGFVTSSSEFNISILKSNFLDSLEKTFRTVTNTNLSIVIVDSKKFNDDFGDTQEREIIFQSNIDSYNLNKRYTFENFISSDANKMLYNATMSIANENEVKWNPLFIFGNSGLGKTHLLNAIGNRKRINSPTFKIKYLEAKDFGRLVHEAMTRNNVSVEIEKIKDTFRSFDVLLIDDIQFIQTWGKVKDIFFQVLNHFISSNLQVVIASDKYPEELGDFEDRFISRFSEGLVLSVLPPDLETSKEIIKNYLKEDHSLNIDMIDEDAIDFIAINFSTNIRILRGAINRIIFWIINNDVKQITLEEVANIFKDVKKNTKGLTTNKIISVVGKTYGISTSELKNASRTKNIILPRQICMYLMRNMLSMSLINIAKEFNKDHTTIMYGIKKVEKLLKDDAGINKVIVDIKGKLTRH